MARHPAELRADLQEFYGIDLDAAAAGGHTPSHVAALLSYLPLGARLRAHYDPAGSWSRAEVLQALLLNAIYAVFGGEDAPQVPIPGYEEQGRHVAGLEFATADELMEYLARPRRASEEVGEV